MLGLKVQCVILLGQSYGLGLGLSSIFQDCGFYSSVGFIDFGVNVWEGYNQGRLVFEEGSDRGNTVEYIYTLQSCHNTQRLMFP